MIIALPLTDRDEFSEHFGASAKAALFEIDPDRRAIACSGVFTPPGLTPCEWAPWLRDLGVNRILARGMGRGAQARLAGCGIEVDTGVEPGELEMLVQAWLDGRLPVGANICAGGHRPGHGCHHDEEHGHQNRDPEHGGAGHGECGCGHESH